MTGECHLCGRYGTVEKHHMLHGFANRKLADVDGLTCYLCRNCHEQVHSNANLDRQLQKAAEIYWLAMNYSSTTEFRYRYGKNYLDEIPVLEYAKECRSCICPADIKHAVIKKMVDAILLFGKDIKDMEAKDVQEKRQDPDYDRER